MQRQFAAIASDPAPMTATQFAGYVKAQEAKWLGVIGSANISAD